MLSSSDSPVDTMSWFDTAGIASLAKSALKEAQKTIDKALDINDEQQPPKSSVVTSPSNSDANTDSFFSAWGLSTPASPEGGEETAVSSTQSPEPTQARKITSSTSIWGSFSGSFFENPQNDGKGGDQLLRMGELISSQPKKSAPSRSLSLDLTNTSLPASKPLEPPQESSNPPPGPAQDGGAPGAEKEKERPSPPRRKDEDSTDDSGEKIREEIRNYPPVEVVFRKREPRNLNNRLSVISSESDRRSTDSCDILGSTSTPDSDPSMSTSSSIARLRQSGSFESVDVLTSPSSVDLISSPGDPKYSSDSVSPVVEGDGVDIIPDDEDEVSVEDSYTSASETTSTVILHDANVMLKSTSSLDTSFSEAMSPRESVRVVVGSAPGRAQQETPPRPGAPENEAVAKSTKGSEISDSVVSDGVETSSCEEGTLMGSSGEGDSALRPPPVPLPPPPPSITNMLAEAMNEPSTIREQSPISSESRSDLVKIGSSEHTSGDELETTTSSDIEIISSPTPNGDSSSTASRHSPSKLAYKGLSLGRIITAKVKGHHREPSEASSGGSDECSEVDKLLKKIAEMSEILDARESKLIDLSRLNAELQESNSELKSQLERQSESQEIMTISEEFTQRMSALERKFQQAVREKELLRKQLDHAKSLAVKRDDDLDKDQLILELRTEGEKLSKQQLTLSNTIKKLRATEKENAKTISYLNEQIQDKTQELERSKKSVLAKEEMERSHIEAVHKLTKENQQLEKDVTSLKTNVAGLTSTIITLQKEVSEKDEAYKVLEKKSGTERKAIEEKVMAELSSDLEASEQQVMTLQSALEDMRRQLLISQEQQSLLEKSLRRDIVELTKRAEAAEQKFEAEAETARLASQPLARQIQFLSDSHASQAASWHSQELKLNNTISGLESRLNSLSSNERKVREQYEHAMSQYSVNQERLSTLQTQNDSLQKELKQTQRLLTVAQENLSQASKKQEEAVGKFENELTETRRELTACQELLSVERAALDAEKRKNTGLQERLRSGRNQSSPPLGSMSPRSSPTLSYGRVSVSDSVSSSVWPSPFGDDMDSASISGRLYEALRPCNNTTYLETLQSQLKLKEGEVQQLQWELIRRERERTALSNEVSELTTRLETHERDLSGLSLLKTQYDALLQMYGEKLEESEELKMDLQDVKDMYKAQIDELLKKEPTPPANS